MVDMVGRKATICHMFGQLQTTLKPMSKQTSLEPNSIGLSLVTDPLEQDGKDQFIRLCIKDGKAVYLTRQDAQNLINQLKDLAKYI